MGEVPNISQTDICELTITCYVREISISKYGCPKIMLSNYDEENGRTEIILLLDRDWKFDMLWNAIEKLVAERGHLT